LERWAEECGDVSGSDDGNGGTASGEEEVLLLCRDGGGGEKVGVSPLPMLMDRGDDAGRSTSSRVLRAA
jgi:hypothetical protein